MDSRSRHTGAIAPRGLQRGDHQAVVDQLQFDDMRCRGDRRLHRGLIALLEPVATGCRRLIPELRRARLQRRRRHPPRRQRLPVHHHQFRRIARGVRVSATTNATGSPTCRTRPDASAGRGGTIIGATVATGTVQGSGPRSARSVCRVDAQHARHRARGRRYRCARSLACAWGERTTCIQAWPGTSMSSTKRPRPVRKRASSSRRSDCPINDMIDPECAIDPACRPGRSPAPVPAASSRWRPRPACRSCDGPAPA